MTPALGTAVLGVALCLAGGGFDTPSLYVPGVALGLLGVGVGLWVCLAARGAEVVRAAGPPTVMEEEPYPLRLQVRSGMLPPPGGELIEPLLGWPVPIGGRWSRRVRINVRFSRRGRRVLAPATLVIRDPLGLATVELAGQDEDNLLVLPRIEPVEPVRAGGTGSGRVGTGGQGHPQRRLDGSAPELEIDGLRPYRQGAPASRIHWPSVARTGVMLERRLVADLDSAPLIVVDAASPESEDFLDRAVRAAASLCVHLARAGGCSILLPGERRPVDIGPELGGFAYVHARLALVEGGTAVKAPGALPRAGAVLWVMAASGARLPRSLGRWPASARYLVSPGTMANGRAAFRVAGCTGALVDRPRSRRGVAA